MPGHWEGDLIMGAYNRSAVGTLIERTTQLVILVKQEGTTATDAAVGFSDKLNEVPRSLRLSMTCDRGSEMVKHAEITQQTGTAIYFADPYSPWQRGSNENINGPIRQYLPKGTDLSVYSQQDLDEIADSLNTRPRKTLGWWSPRAREGYIEVLRTSVIGPSPPELHPPRRCSPVACAATAERKGVNNDMPYFLVGSCPFIVVSCRLMIHALQYECEIFSGLANGCECFSAGRFPLPLVFLMEDIAGNTHGNRLFSVIVML